MENRYQTRKLTPTPTDLATAADLLRLGGLVAMPTETVYGLAANALDAEAVERIFLAKQRPHWDPLIVHVADEAMLRNVVAGVDDIARTLMAVFWPGPLTLLLPRSPAVPGIVTAGRERVGVRMPSHPVSLALIRAAGLPLAAPSANRFGHVSPTTAAHVLADLDGRINAVVDAGPCAIGVESTVVEPGARGVTLYRAGGVSAAQLEAAAGVPVTVYLPPSLFEPQSLPSPGVGIRHYATRAPVRLVHSLREMEDTVRTPEARFAAVLLPANWSLPEHAGPLRRWADAEDGPALAAQLYDGLRALDAQNPPMILVPLPSRTDGVFAALRDRLLKASRPA